MVSISRQKLDAIKLCNCRHNALTESLAPLHREWRRRRMCWSPLSRGAQVTAHSFFRPNTLAGYLDLMQFESDKFAAMLWKLHRALARCPYTGTGQQVDSRFLGMHACMHALFEAFRKLLLEIRVCSCMSLGDAPLKPKCDHALNFRENY